MSEVTFTQEYTPLVKPEDSITVGNMIFDRHDIHPYIFISRTEPFIFANNRGIIYPQKPCIQDGANGSYVNLRVGSFPVHELIATQYIRNDDPIHKTVIDHRNRIATDNRIENLRYVTPRLSNFNRRVDPRHYFIDHLSDQAYRIPTFNGHQLDDDECHFWFDPTVNMLYVQVDVNNYRSFVLSSNGRFKTSAVDKTQVNMKLSDLQQYNQ